MSNAVKYLNGLGLVASKPRNIKSGAQFDKYFSAPKRQDKYLTYAGTTNDTIEFMADIIKSTLDDTKKIAPLLKGKDLESTLRNIFNFIFTHIQYKPDDPKNEELRRPRRGWADRTTGIDCDCYSIFIGSILSNLNIPFALKMVKIHNKPYYQHVYVTVPKNGTRAAIDEPSAYYTVDPVLDTFDEEHPFTGKYEIFMQPIKYLNGIGSSASLNGLAGDADNLYYSEEAAADYQSPSNTVFFDGLDYYERVSGMEGLAGLNGLNGWGFLRKAWGGIKAGAKFVKKIGKKAIKKVAFRKDGSKRKIFQAFSGNPEKKAARQERRAGKKAVRVQRREARQLERAGREQMMQPMQSLPAQITPLGTGAGVNPKDMIDIAQSMDKSMGVDSVLNMVKTFAPDNSLINEVIDAKSKVNKGLSTMDARLISKDVAKANEAEITKNVMDQVYRMKSLEQPKQAGFGGMTMPTIMMGALAIGALGFAFTQRNRTATA